MWYKFPFAVNVILNVSTVGLHVALGNLRFSYHDGNENVKKAIVSISKTTTSHVHHAFLYISLPSLHTLRAEATFSRARLLIITRLRRENT